MIYIWFIAALFRASSAQNETPMRLCSIVAVKTSTHSFMNVMRVMVRVRSGDNLSLLIPVLQATFMTSEFKCIEGLMAQIGTSAQCLQITLPV